jgi:hypothetical protein
MSKLSRELLFPDGLGKALSENSKVRGDKIVQLGSKSFCHTVPHKTFPMFSTFRFHIL